MQRSGSAFSIILGFLPLSVGAQQEGREITPWPIAGSITLSDDFYAPDSTISFRSVLSALTVAHDMLVRRWGHEVEMRGSTSSTWCGGPSRGPSRRRTRIPTAVAGYCSTRLSVFSERSTSFGLASSTSFP